MKYVIYRFSSTRLAEIYSFDNTVYPLSHTPLMVASVAQCCSTCGRSSSNHYQNYRYIILFAPESSLLGICSIDTCAQTQNGTGMNLVIAASSPVANDRQCDF